MINKYFRFFSMFALSAISILTFNNSVLSAGHGNKPTKVGFVYLTTPGDHVGLILMK